MLTFVLCPLFSLFAADTNSTAAKAAAARAALLATPIPRSVFVVPKSHAEGVDPFFPLSTRLAVTSGDAATNRPAAYVELSLKGFSGSAASPLVIINDRTFAAGEEKTLVTPQGRALVRCLEIRAKDETAVVEVNHERRELRFQAKRKK